MNTKDFDDALSNAIEAIDELRTGAERLKNDLEEIIEACDTIEGEL